MSQLAIHGGEKTVTLDQSQASQWPIIDDEVIAAVTATIVSSISASLLNVSP